MREAQQAFAAHPSAANSQALAHASDEARARLQEVFAALENGSDPGASEAARSLDAAWSNGLGRDQGSAGGGSAGSGSQGQGAGGSGASGATGNQGQGTVGGSTSGGQSSTHSTSSTTTSSSTGTHGHGGHR